ncbi:MAG: hypothetical protein ACE5JJ_08550, partial [Nitrospinota bacterium]
MIAGPASAGGERSHLIRTIAFLAAATAVLSGLYHIAAIYLRPLPGEMHPNMHLLLAFTILLLGGAARDPESYDVSLGELGVLVLSLVPATYFFFFTPESETGWPEAGVWPFYLLPPLALAALLIRERAWLCLSLSLISLIPSALLFANWSALPESVQEPTTWWLLLFWTVPTAWVLFHVF